MAGAQTQIGPASAGLRLLSFLAALAPAPAFAGAWITPEGTQQIWTNEAGERDGLYTFETDLYLEKPLGHDTSFVLAPMYEENYDTPDGWRAEGTLGLKHVVLRHDQTVVALQASALWVSDPRPGCGEGGAELRVLAGRPDGDHAFVNIEAAERVLDGGCGGQRLDVTAGYRPNRHWLILGQVFLDELQDGDESVKAQLSLVHFGHRRRGFQLGFRARVDGDDAEPALVVGLWRAERGHPE